MRISSPSLASKCAYTNICYLWSCCQITWLRRDLWLLRASGTLGQQGQHGHCICHLSIMAIVEIPKCATVLFVCIFLDF